MFFSCWLDLLAELGLPTAQNQQHNIDRGNGAKHVTWELSSLQTDRPSSPVILLYIINVIMIRVYY